MKIIRIIFTGGTIGSKLQGKQVDVAVSGGFALLERYRQDPARRDVRFVPEQPLNTLSEDLLPSAWLVMKAAIEAAAKAGCDGILLTHGTDTLPFTAAALSFIFNTALPVPILLVSANFPLDDPHSNGYMNFCMAVNMICDAPTCGVFVPFFQAGAGYLHLGTRLGESKPFQDDFFSVGDLWWAKAQPKGYDYNPQSGNISPAALAAWQPTHLPHISFHDHILFLKPYTGLNYGMLHFDAEHPPAAIVHGTYHSGTACTADEEAYSAAAFVLRCREQNIPVYLAPIPRREGQRYASTERLLEAGAIALEDMSEVAAFVKVMLAYGSLQGESERLEYLKKDIFFEHVGN